MENNFFKMLEELKQEGMDTETLAQIEVINAYATNLEFKKNLEKYVFEDTYNGR